MLLEKPGNLRDEPDIRQKLETILAAALQGTELIQRMQNFYRGAKHAETFQRVDTNGVIRQVVELARMRWKRITPGNNDSFEVVLNLGPDTEITGKPSSIHEMLLNLMLNAADAMPTGGRFEISSMNTGDAVEIAVSDTGVGMSREIMEKCFLPFFTTKGAEGTGMGLSMVNTIVNEHGGRVEIESGQGDGGGTRFTITFPLPRSRTPSMSEQQSPA